MKTYGIILGLFAFFVLCGSTCSKESELHETIIFRNNSTTNVYVDFSYFYYPDTSITLRNPLVDPAHTFSIKGNDKPLTLLDAYERIFKQFDTIMIFVFDENTLKTVDWETVKSDYLILKRYDLSKEDLDSLNWIIEYP